MLSILYCYFASRCQGGSSQDCASRCLEPKTLNMVVPGLLSLVHAGPLLLLLDLLTYLTPQRCCSSLSFQYQLFCNPVVTLLIRTIQRVNAAMSIIVDTERMLWHNFTDLSAFNSVSSVTPQLTNLHSCRCPSLVMTQRARTLLLTPLPLPLE